ncbi:glycerol-3-phosphate 1-O-acyltransferase PlsB [Propionivibrio soli]|uniref:glycerol-3-phosphate 1-O-acyltransferase PlsB n=1 Tax=Propionivibrio soli TaxID=2976531 RepID=UPI0021E95803|nr:glycerol-3-phosphate 1-O-acyltransferase PlsB [Propionivibrio soli]
MPGWVLPLARRALYFWVRTTVLPENLPRLGVDATKPVVYVLQERSLANLLILFEESLRAGLPSAAQPIVIEGRHFGHSAFSLGGRQALFMRARDRYAHPSLMTAIVRRALNDPAGEFQIVPVTILWGRRPDKQDSILKALFSETWRRTGVLYRLLTLVLHGRNVLVRFNPPLSLNILSHEGLDEGKALRKLSRVLRVHFRRQRLMAIGPDLSHRHTQIDVVLAGAPVQAAIKAEATAHRISIKQAENRARRFALEIVSDYSYGTLRALELFLSWLWNRLYDGIEIHNIEAVTRIAPNQGIVYVPAHRSHIDYLLLSYCLYRQGLTPPHIAAGANLNMPIVGAVLRRCGAFFLRRSLKGQALYAAVFHEYLHLMLTRGFPVEYFIEGGRSRTGRTLTPKAGILGMTISSFIREHNRPLVFVPVYIGYEKVIEGRTYLAELAGKPKRKESLRGLIRSLRHIKRIFGKVHLNFGHPLPLAEFLESDRPGWTTQSTDPESDWPRLVTRKAALELARRLNEAVVINPVNLIALALLPTPRRTADELTLTRMLAHYQALTVDAPYSSCVVPCSLSTRQILNHVERLGLTERVPHPLGDLIRVPEKVAPLLAYFRNNVLHAFALPALVACLLSHNRALTAGEVNEVVASMYTLVGPELFLPWLPSELASRVGPVVETLAERGLLKGNESGRLSAPEPNSPEFAELRLLGETLRPMLERHLLMLALLQHGGSGRLTRRALENDSHLLSQRLSLLYDFTASEYAEKTAFSALISHLIDAELLSEDAGGLLRFDEGLLTPLAYAELLLPIEARQAIRRMATQGW